MRTVAVGAAVAALVGVGFGACASDQKPKPESSATASAGGPCDDFNTDRDDEINSPRVTLSRASGWEESSDLKGTNGKSVGKIWNREEADLGNHLTKGKKGCFRFRRKSDNGVVTITSRLHIQGGGSPVDLDKAAICWGPPHEDDVATRWDPVPPRCDHLEYTFIVKGITGKPDTIRGVVDANPNLTPTRAQVDSELVARARDKGVDEAVAKVYADWLFLGGPWFPCALTGCCRAY